ncbi:Endonuclease/exonuclease/phosphatase [Diaporthe sp. PMI_573]|nr:Endonuclease/exonuclease/phosphatase [Diaporthaceae sp. PMI_573]
MDGMLSKLQQVATDGSGPNIIFFQEVSQKALAHLLQAAWVREHWVSSDADETNWADVPFATMTLLSRSLIGASSPNSPNSEGNLESTSASTAGGPYGFCPVWRVRYPSRFKRDALCCDILWDRDTRIRLVNVHLDSLPIQPNQRPRQVAIAASLLRTAGVGRGVIAGDWNPVSEEDNTLLQGNGLVDVWERLRPGEDGFTWGLNGKSEPFPPARLDKVAVLGLKPLGIQTIHPETLSIAIDSGDEATAGNGGKGVPWSDHSGLLCSFVVDDGQGG